MNNQLSSLSDISPLANGSEGRMPLRFHVQQAVEQYFVELEGETATNRYQTILQEVEKPFIRGCFGANPRQSV